MATVLESLRKSSINIKNISKSLTETKKSTSAVNDSVENISRIIGTNTRVKRELFTRSNVLSSRREEASKRQELEDQIESTKVSTSPQAGLSFASRSEKGPLDRLLGFLGFMTAGWILENLPTWIFMGQEFISRINSFGRSMYNMVNNMQFIIKSFGQTLGYSLDAILRLDFEEFAGEGTVAKSFEELNLAVQDLGTNITDTFKLFTTPLTESLETGEQAPGLEERQPDTMFPGIQQEGASSRVTGTMKQALDIISGPESGGSYNAMNQGTIGGKIVGSTLDSKSKIKKNLTDMTIGEVLQRQQWLMNKSNPQVSNYGVYAAGRYQFIPNTLPGVMKSAGLSPGDKFSPENQDLMASTLLKQRGIQPWTVGGSRYSAKELQIVERARKEPVSYTPSTPSVKPSSTLSSPPPKPQSGKGNGFLTISDLIKIKPLAMTPDYKDWYGNNAFLNPAAGKAFLAAQKAYGKDIPINSAYRSFEHQKAIGGKYGVVAAPGTSKHGLGLGLDLEPGTAYYKWMKENGSKFGWYYANISGDPYHFEYRGGGALASPLPSAEISSQPKPKQPAAAITPERKGSQIMIIDDTKPQVPQVSYPSQQPSVTPTISEFKLLNNFIKNKLLLDLAYL